MKGIYICSPVDKEFVKRPDIAVMNGEFDGGISVVDMDVADLLERAFNEGKTHRASDADVRWDESKTYSEFKSSQGIHIKESDEKASYAADKDCPPRGEKALLICTACERVWTEFVLDADPPDKKYPCTCHSAVLTGRLFGRSGKSVEGSKLNREARAAGERV